MTDQETIDYLEEKYIKDQKLLLTLRYKDNKKTFRDLQEVECSGITLLTIQTLDRLYDSELAHTPYCIRNSWGGHTITVQKFGQLTDEEIHKAIGYVLNKYEENNLFFIWNVYLNNKHIKTRYIPIYTVSPDELPEKQRWLRKQKG